MNRAGLSVFVFGIYMILLGILMVVIPNLLLISFGVPSTSEVWIRVAGMLVITIGFYDLMAGLKNLPDFLRWSVMAGVPVILVFASFVLLGFVKLILLLFGVIDLAGATWTYLALRVKGTPEPAFYLAQMPLPGP